MKPTDEPIEDNTAAATAEQAPVIDEGGPTYPQVQLLQDGKNPGKSLIVPMGGISFHRSIVLACLPGLMDEAFAKTHTDWDITIDHAFTIADKVVARYANKQPTTKGN